MEQEKDSPRDDPQNPRMKLHVAPDLEYVYRDLFNVFVGQGDVVIEFGNQHRAIPGHGVVSNRIVMSISNAYVLTRTMQEALQKAHDNLQRNLQKMDVG